MANCILYGPQLFWIILDPKIHFQLMVLTDNIRNIDYGQWNAKMTTEVCIVKIIVLLLAFENGVHGSEIHIWKTSIAN